MPYIPRTFRYGYNQFISELSIRIENPGELNYCISKLCVNYLLRRGTSYIVLNDIMGVLDCASKEFYRRFVAPYEDEKIIENGDIV